jgi:hypothetical protein
LEIHTINGYSPLPGSSFPVVTYGSHTGAFARITSQTGASFQPTYGPRALTLTTDGVASNHDIATGQILALRVANANTLLETSSIGGSDGTPRGGAPGSRNGEFGNTGRDALTFRRDESRRSRLKDVRD